MPSRKGIRAVEPREGDKQQAVAHVNCLVRAGLLPHPTQLPCEHCGHRGGDRRHDYHHHRGYSVAHQADVIVLCRRCHKRAHAALITHCKHGHEYTPENTIRKSNGTRQCRACVQAHDRKRRRRRNHGAQY
jgi:hypothetical protein